MKRRKSRRTQYKVSLIGSISSKWLQNVPDVTSNDRSRNARGRCKAKSAMEATLWRMRNIFLDSRFDHYLRNHTAELT